MCTSSVKCSGSGWGVRVARRLRTIAAHSGVDRMTVRRYVEAAQAAGSAVVAGMHRRRPDRGGGGRGAPGTPGRSWLGVGGVGAVRGTDLRLGERRGRHEPLSVTKIEVLLTGRAVWCRTGRCIDSHGALRFQIEGDDGAGRRRRPGVECQLDFGYMGSLTNPETGRRRKVHALIFTACYSRHQFVWLTHAQTWRR